MLTKQCARPGCRGLIRAKNLSTLKRRVYCGRSCTQAMSVESRRLGQEDKVLQQAQQRIQEVLCVNVPPSPVIARLLRRLRANAYRAGWTTASRRVKRLMARGVLVVDRDRAARA